jgi:O-methyltransferase involved in polyketide biosynthesis
MARRMDFSRISSTAFMTALARQASDLPWTRAMAERLVLHRLGNLPLLVEARHRAIDHALQTCDARQVVELASGFLARGLSMTDDPDVVFVETDLPDVVALKRTLIDELAPGRSNLHGRAVDATATPNPLLELRVLFDNRPVHVVCEGLLMYLDFVEKAKVCTNVRDFLTHTGGSWITPDFCTTAGLRTAAGLDEHTSRRLQRLANETGRSLRDNAFDSLDAARTFVREQGFDIDELPFAELRSSLVCIERLPLPAATMDAILASPGQRVFRLRVRQS